MSVAYSYLRFSSPEQFKGRSIVRQPRKSREYAAEHGLELIEMEDRGFSAWVGEHIEKGALGRFLVLVKARPSPIERGSLLLVEDLDRLSREDPLAAMTQFTDLMAAGIKIVMLSITMTLGPVCFVPCPSLSAT